MSKPRTWDEVDVYQVTIPAQSFTCVVERGKQPSLKSLVKDNAIRFDTMRTQTTGTTPDKETYCVTLRRITHFHFHISAEDEDVIFDHLTEDLMEQLVANDVENYGNAETSEYVELDEVRLPRFPHGETPDMEF